MTTSTKRKDVKEQIGTRLHLVTDECGIEVAAYFSGQASDFIQDSTSTRVTNACGPDGSLPNCAVLRMLFPPKLSSFNLL